AYLDRGARVLLAFQGGGGLQVRDTATGRVVHEAGEPGPGGLVDCALSPDGARLAVATGAGDLHLLAVPPLKGLGHAAGAPPRAAVVAFSGDGRRLATGGRDHNVFLFDAATLRPLLRFPGQLGEVRSLAFSADGAYLAVGGHEELLTLYDLDRL